MKCNSDMATVRIVYLAFDFMAVTDRRLECDAAHITLVYKRLRASQH
jgi:hypothetical protein